MFGARIGAQGFATALMRHQPTALSYRPALVKIWIWDAAF